MPEKSFAFAEGEAERLTVIWKRGWRKLRITVDTVPVLSVDSRKALVKGSQTVPAPSGIAAAGG